MYCKSLEVYSINTTFALLQLRVFLENHQQDDQYLFVILYQHTEFIFNIGIGEILKEPKNYITAFTRAIELTSPRRRTTVTL